MIIVRGKRENGSKFEYLDFSDEVSLTDQSFAEDCDVNNIVSKYMKTGVITHLRGSEGQMADVSSAPDLLEAMITVTQAQQQFEQLPAQLRDRFGNSPVNLVEFLDNPANDEEAVKLGLKVKTRTETPVSDEPKRKRGSSSTTATISHSKPTQKNKPHNDDELNDDDTQA